MTTKPPRAPVRRPPVPPTHYDPQYDALAEAVLVLQQRVAALEARVGIHTNQRNCSRCGRLLAANAHHCALCGGSPGS